jgi:hypothetical protein
MMELRGMVAFLRGGDRFVMVFTLGEGGAAANGESQREENDGDGSELHFFTLSTTDTFF